jgi:outer membrane protein TolC
MKTSASAGTTLALSCVLLLILFTATLAAQAPVRLTLQDAIERALAANLNGQLAAARIDEAQGTRLRRYAATMLPRVSAQAYANVQNRNLNAFGISLPEVPKVVGPFSNYDLNLSAQQNIVDLAGYRSLKASDRTLDADKLDYRDTRDLIVRYVAQLYLIAESAAARIESSQSRVTDSNTLYKLARDRHDAGAATGVDVLRAEVQLANDKQALLIAQNQFKQSLLELARYMGMNPATPLELAETLSYQPLQQIQAETLIQSALVVRADYLSLASQRQSLVEQLRANRARSYPKLSLNGSYGGIGRSVGGMQGTGILQGQIDVTLFDRDRQGEAQELASRIKSIDDRVADLRRGIEEDVREALLNLTSAAEQVIVATDGRQLAERELELAQDRFAQGTTNNVEVVTAQDELARAEENYILAVSSHIDAKFALARALGDTEKKIAEFTSVR